MHGGAVPRQVESRLPGRPGPAGSAAVRLSHSSKGHRRRRLRRRPGEGESPGGWERGAASLSPRLTRDLGLGAPAYTPVAAGKGERLRGPGSLPRVPRGGGAESWEAPPTRFGGADLGLGARAAEAPDP